VLGDGSERGRCWGMEERAGGGGECEGGEDLHPGLTEPPLNTSQMQKEERDTL